LFILLDLLYFQLLSILPTAPKVKEVVTDFESAVWSAVPEVLPDVSLHGCSFHWGQAVWRKVGFLKNNLSIHFPDMSIKNTMYDHLTEKADGEKLVDLVEYVGNTWMRSTLWPPAHWSNYGMPTRTNNDVEGWHYRFNAKVRLL
jgi:hypothetical protein